MDRRQDGCEVARSNLSSEETVADDNARDHEQHGLKQHADMPPAQERTNNGQPQNVHEWILSEEEPALARPAPPEL